MFFYLSDHNLFLKDQLGRKMASKCSKNPNKNYTYQIGETETKKPHAITSTDVKDTGLIYLNFTNPICVVSLTGSNKYTQNSIYEITAWKQQSHRRPKQEFLIYY